MSSKCHKSRKITTSHEARRCNLLVTTPSFEDIVFNSELIQNLSDKVVGKIFDSFWFMVKTWHGWQYYSSCFTQPQHILKMNCRQRCLSRNEYELSRFFNTNSCCPRNCTGIVSTGNPGCGFHAAWHNC